MLGYRVESGKIGAQPAFALADFDVSLERGASVAVKLGVVGGYHDAVEQFRRHQHPFALAGVADRTELLGSGCVSGEAQRQRGSDAIRRLHAAAVRWHSCRAAAMTAR